MKKNDMNLLERYNDLHKERSNKFSPTRVYLAVLVVVFLLLGAFTLQFWIRESGLKSDVASLRAYNESAEVKAKMDEVKTLKANIQSLDQMLTEVKSINTVFGSAIRFNSFTLDVLYNALPRYVGFDLVGYSAGAINVEIHGPRPSDFSNYVLRLISEDYFKSVSYSEYTYDPTAKLYYATIRCVLKGGN